MGPMSPTPLIKGTEPSMTTTTHPTCTRGPLISVEGMTGVGKNFLTTRALDPVSQQDRPVLLAEFSQRTHDREGLGDHLLHALREASAPDPFLRGGTPMAEALLLLAIKRHDLDTVLPAMTQGRAVVEGRSVDSTAVCQALLLHPHDPDTALDTAQALLNLASSYRPLPDLTILLTDTPDRAIDRAQHRDQRTFTPEQTAFIHCAGRLFERLAATDPARFQIADRRRLDTDEAAELIRSWIRAAGTGLGCVREPFQSPPSPCLCCGQRSESVPV
jgi:dTMP kinase